jgi:lipopolysaccharide transport system ATP-binding protein
MYSDALPLTTPSLAQEDLPRYVIDIQGVSKIYRSYTKPSQRLRELFAAPGEHFFRETRALDDVSLQLKPGSRLGILGENGSGKSTLLKLICGVLTPSSGSVHVQGRISALLELGAGFNPHLAGRENIRQFCMLHGMSGDEIEAAMPDIIRFSELHEAIEHPVKTYSSGMAVRLGFSCAVYAQPDILIVDEALSVGDSYFQNKCLHKIKALLDEGVTFLYVTHSADGIRSLCEQGLWLDQGQVRLAGGAREVGAAYQAEVFRRMAAAGFQRKASGTPESAGTAPGHSPQALHQAFAARIAPLRTGSGEVRMQYIAVLDENDQETDHLPFGSQVRVRLVYQVQQAFSGQFSITLGITDSSGRQLMHFNAASEGVFIPSEAAGGGLRQVDFDFACPLCPGEYGLIAGIGTFTENPVNPGQLMVAQVVDYCAGGNRFAIGYPEARQNLWGVVHVPHAVSDQPWSG